MKNIRLLFAFCFLHFALSAQTVQQKLQTAYLQFEADSQLRHAIGSLYVINAKTGEIIFDKNSQIGLAGASTQKIITAATAFELLGKDYRYATSVGHTGSIKNKILDGSIYIKGSVDPTLGSWRWGATNEDSVISRIIEAIKKLGITNYKSIVVDAADMEDESIPDGWMWQDIGNYYGAGAAMINWRENQYDLVLKSGAIRDEKVNIVETKPKLYGVSLISYLKTAPKGTGDNAYIYLPIGSSTGVVRGTIPVGQDRFVISGAMPSGRNQFLLTLIDSLDKNGIKNQSGIETINQSAWQKFSPDWIKQFHEELSPSLDSIIYWFLKRSVNLYGEALVKTFAYVKNKYGDTDSGVAIIKDFWKQKGLDPEEINIKDGSGLSPQNRITTHAQVEILKYAKQQSWFPYFFNALPEFNNMKMKSGTINDVKGFCGYHTSGDGNEYIFSFLINNYSGRSSAVVNKMYKVLDVLK
jgi:D-alanyl-D-alanine carboxypeptidase/D-alanyl-D-alanine-endopeptidase (penicillin-binding protein 4)